MSNYSGVTPGTGNAEHSPESGPVSPGPRTHIRSWSQLNGFRNCPKSWELAKIRKAPRRPGVWNPAGTAVHATIERYLRARLQEGTPSGN